MKISRLIVNGLFGLYNYDIDFSRQGEYFTVLTSPNGYGKTTLLRIINSLHVRRLYYLYALKFERILFVFDDKSQLEAKELDFADSKMEDSDTRRNKRRGLSLIWSVNDDEICRFDYRPELIEPAKRNAVRKIAASRHYPGDMYEENEEFFVDGDGGEALNTELAQIQKQEQFLLQMATIQTDFIGANRIYATVRMDRASRRYRELPVLQVVSELRDMLTERVIGFQNNFQRLDSKLIDMLLGGHGQEISEVEYKDRANKLAIVIDELFSYGLTNRQVLPEYQAGNAKVLDVYLQQMEEKLRYYDYLLPLVRLFNKNIQRKSFANKTIKLSPQHGLRIESDNGDILSADMLSTGEQNQIVLLYDLIFKTPKGSILLIDEPESSLHVAWQNDFVSDMQTIAKSKELQIVVATHSPIIVSNTTEEKVFDLFYLQN